jgi:magnesium transporter
MTTLDIQFVTPAGAHPEPVDRLPALLEEPGAGFVWVDIAEWSEQAEHLLVDTLHLHPMAVAACRDRNHTPTVHGYPDHGSWSCTAPRPATTVTYTSSSWTCSSGADS